MIISDLEEERAKTHVNYMSQLLYGKLNLKCEANLISTMSLSILKIWFLFICRDLSNNKLDSIPGNLFSTNQRDHTLVALFLSGNNLKTIPAELFGRLHHLQHL